MELRVSTVAKASLPMLALSFHRFASLLLLSVGYGWFFSPPEGDRGQGSRRVGTYLGPPV